MIFVRYPFARTAHFVFYLAPFSPGGLYPLPCYIPSSFRRPSASVVSLLLFFVLFYSVEGRPFFS